MKTKKSYKITCLQEIDSTNAYAMRNLANLSDQEIIVSNRQTAGKGRLNRSWLSDRENNVYLSIVLKPCEKVGNNLPLVNLTQYMSVILCKILENYGVTAEIKWPNDVLVNGKKIAGILSQVSVQGDKFKGIVLGVGVNLNLTQEDLDKINQPAVSLNLLLGKPVHKDSFVEKILDNFFENYKLFLKQGFPFIKNEYIKRNNFIGKQIAVNTPCSCETGTVQGVRDDGSLVILDTEMNEKIITIGDIIC